MINVPYDATNEDDDLLTINGMREGRKLGLCDEKRVLHACLQRASSDEYNGVVNAGDVEQCEEAVEQVMGIKRNRQRVLPLYCVPSIVSNNFESECSGVMKALTDAGGIRIGTFNGSDMKKAMKCCLFVMTSDGGEFELGAGMSMIRLTEGLLPIAINGGAKKSVSICVRGGLGCDDIDQIFNTYLTSRASQQTILRYLPDTFRVTDLHETPYKRSAVIKWYGDDTPPAMNNVTDKLESDGFEIWHRRGVDLTCITQLGAQRQVQATVWGEGIDVVALCSPSAHR